MGTWQFRFRNEWRDPSYINLLRLAWYRAPGDHFCVQLSIAGLSACLYRWRVK